MIISSDAYVLKKYDLTESSFIVVFFTKEAGIQRVVAKGAKRHGSAFKGTLEMLNLLEIEFTKKEWADLGVLRRSEVITSAFSLFSDYEVAKKLFAISEILCKALAENQREDETFRLTTAVMEALKQKVSSEWAFNYFILWFLKLNGVLSRPNHCGKCKKARRPVAFNREEGGWLCKDCRKESGFVLSPDAIKTMNNLFGIHPGRLPGTEGEKFPKELQTMLYFSLCHFLGSDLESLRIGM